MTEKQVVKVLTKFWDDHTYRCESPELDGPTGTELERGKVYTWVDFTDDEFANFLGDAEYYALLFRGGEWRLDDDPGLYRLGESAVRTVKWLERNYSEYVARFRPASKTGDNR